MAMMKAIKVTVVKHHFQAISRLTCLKFEEKIPTGFGFSSPSFPFSVSSFFWELSLGRSGEFSSEDIL
jgi:hypothetical protein